MAAVKLCRVIQSRGLSSSKPPYNVSSISYKIQATLYFYRLTFSPITFPSAQRLRCLMSSSKPVSPPLPRPTCSPSPTVLCVPFSPLMALCHPSSLSPRCLQSTQHTELSQRIFQRQIQRRMTLVWSGFHM